MRIQHATLAMVLPLLLACSRVDSADGAGDAKTPDAGPPSRMLSEGTWSLDSESLAASDDDLAPLSSVLDGAEIVAIGESWHTTGGQHGMRARAVRYLVEHEGVRNVMLESPRLSAAPLSAYVAEGGDLKAALGSVFELFASAQMQELMLWLRNWNVSHPNDPVTFDGFDIQEPAALGYALRQYVQSAAPARKQELLDFLPACYCGSADTQKACALSPDAKLGYWAGGVFPAERDNACKAGLTNLEAVLRRDQASFVMASSERAWEMAVLATQSLQASHVSAASEDFLTGFLARDEGMKDVVLAMHRMHPSGKSLLMAHNAHVERSDDNGWLRGNGMPNQRGMGARLFAALGHKYKVLGQLSWDTQINWGKQPSPKPNNRANSIELALDGLGKPYLFVNLRGTNESVKVGEVYTMDVMAGVQSFVPSETFDALLFMHQSSAMQYITR